MSNSSVTSNSSVSSRAMEIVSAGWPWIGSPMARIAWAKAATSCCARHVAGLEMHLGHAEVVAGDEAVEDFGEEAALLLAEPAGNAEIDGDDGAVRIDEQIARMHVGVEEAVAQRVAQEGLHRFAAIALRSWPAARSASTSDILMPSIHSIVSTSRPVRSQSTAGTRKPGSSRRVLGRARRAPRPPAGDPSRSWSSAPASSVTSTGRSRRVDGMKRSCRRAARK